MSRLRPATRRPGRLRGKMETGPRRRGRRRWALPWRTPSGRRVGGAGRPEEVSERGGGGAGAAPQPPPLQLLCCEGKVMEGGREGGPVLEAGVNVPCVCVRVCVPSRDSLGALPAPSDIFRTPVWQPSPGGSGGGGLSPARLPEAFAPGRAARLPPPPAVGTGSAVCPSRWELLVNGRSLFWELCACEGSGFGAGGEGSWGAHVPRWRSRPARGLEAMSLGQTPPWWGIGGGCVEGRGETSGGIQSPPGPIWLRWGPCCSQSVEGHCQNSALRHPLSCLVSGVRVEIPPSPAKALAQMTQKKELTWSVQALRSITAGLLGMGKVSRFPQSWIGPVLMVGSGTRAQSYFGTV